MKRGYEAWRPALIAFYRKDGPWFQKIENLTRGGSFTPDDLKVIEGLKAAVEQMSRVA